MVPAKDSDGGPPEVVLQSLQSASRAEEIRNERREAWRQATTTRRKRTTMGHCRDTDKAHLHKYFEKRVSVFKFTGKVGDHHHVFAFVEHSRSPCGPPRGPLHSGLWGLSFAAIQ